MVQRTKQVATTTPNLALSPGYTKIAAVIRGVASNPFAAALVPLRQALLCVGLRQQQLPPLLCCSRPAAHDTAIYWWSGPSSSVQSRCSSRRGRCGLALAENPVWEDAQQGVVGGTSSSSASAEAAYE